MSLLKKHDGRVFFVNLISQEKELYKRISGSSRKKFNKTTSVMKLKKALKKWNFNKKVPFGETLEIDNTRLFATAAVKQIKKHFGL